jgi:large subunit ribosomal protein L10
VPTPKKAAAIDELAEQLREVRAVFLTDYRGLPTPELNQLRVRLRDVDAEYKIVKNTLLIIAAKRLGIQGADSLLEGPTAMAVSSSEDSKLAKALLDYIRTSRSQLKVKGGILGTTVLQDAEVATLATLPPKADLQARLVGDIQGALGGFVGVLNAALSELLSVFDERAKQLGGGEAPAEAPAQTA